MKQRLTETQALFETGFAEETDADQIAIAVANLENEYGAAEQLAQLSYRLLLYQIGYDLDASVGISQTLDDIIADLTRDLLEQEFQVEDLGYRVQMLLIESRNGTMSDVGRWEYFVSTDGRVGATHTVCIRGPQYGDDEKLKTPAGPKEYSTAINAALTEEGSRVLPEYIQPTGKIVKIPIPGDVDPKNYQVPTDRPPPAKAGRAATDPALPEASRR